MSFSDLEPVGRLTAQLIKEASVTPDASSALDIIAERLGALGFTIHRQSFSANGEVVPNLYARLGVASPNFCFAGHTDVVPATDLEHWETPPFEPTVKDGVLRGRGAADMKGALAAMLIAIEEHVAKGPFAGSISVLFTGDEEGAGIDGTKAMLKWLKERDEQIDLCLVGEPTNPETFGEMMKIGRRGSMHGYLTVPGTSGHVAYPQHADNPIPKLVELLAALKAPIDDGNDYFQPSNLEVLDLQVGNDRDNVVPHEARARFNVRFNSDHSPASLQTLLEARLDAVGHRYDLEYRVSGESFLTSVGALSDAVASAVKEVSGREPVLSTTGGTSDARFIKDHCPVVEFGLVGQTMHKANEEVALEDLDKLTRVYVGVLARLLPH